MPGLRAGTCSSCKHPPARFPRYAWGDVPVPRHNSTSGVQQRMTPYPEWLYILSWAYLSGSFVCALMIVIDELRRPQKLMIMNFVWPITALYLGPAALWG